MEWRIVKTGIGTDTIEADGITTADGVLTLWKLTGKQPQPLAASPMLTHGTVIKAYGVGMWITVEPVADAG